MALAYNRLIPRIDTYTNWDTANTLQMSLNKPGLYLAMGEMAVVLADTASANAGLSLPATATPSELAKPAYKRKAKAGEVLMIKIGMGLLATWSNLPVIFPNREIHIDGGKGRFLGTRVNQSDPYNFLNINDAVYKILEGVYTPPSAGLVMNSTGGAHATLLEVGAAIQGVDLTLTPYPQTYQVWTGQIYETTNGITQNFGAAESQVRGGTNPVNISAFTRTNLQYSGSNDFIVLPTDQIESGVIKRKFIGKVTDDRPSPDGNNTVSSNGVEVSAAYPEFTGVVNITAAALEAMTPTALGSYIQQNLQARIAQPGSYGGPSQPYSVNAGDVIIYAIPNVTRYMSSVIDHNVSTSENQFAAGKEYDNTKALQATISKAGFYTNVAYTVVRSVDTIYGSGLLPHQFNIGGR
jgi:hypothetical protein